MEKFGVADEMLFVMRERAATADDESPTAELVRAAQAGDREAFGRLYQSYGAMVHGILLARVPFAEVDDLVQEVFLAAFRKLKDLRDRRTFGGWLAMIARNRAHDFHRDRRVTEELDEQVVCDSPDRIEALEALRLMDKLPEAYRETLILRFVEGMSGAEIAARTGLTPASVRVNIHRGMRQLRLLARQTGEVK